jgi:hypothetical protein
VTGVAVAAAPSVRAVRALTRRPWRQQWLDIYVTGFTLGIAALYLGNLLSGPFGRLSAHSPGSHPAGQAEAGLALVIAAGAGALLLAQALGPLTLSPADASWLLLSPLNRRDLLRRPALAACAVAAPAGALLGVLALAMAAPYVHGFAIGRWLPLSACAGAGFALAAILAAIATQPTQRHLPLLRLSAVSVAAAAVIAAVAGQHWAALPGATTSGLGGLSPAVAAWLAVAGLLAALAAAVAAWRALPGFPAGMLRDDSLRAGSTRLAVSMLNIPLLTWIAEDAHWRRRAVRSRPWPAFVAQVPAFALAWADWRRLARRPPIVAAAAASAVAPALVAGAITGHARGLGTAAALLLGGVAAGILGTAARRRDANDRTLRQLLGVGARAALAARAVLPALLSGGWMALALALLISASVLHGWLWPLLGLLAGPGLAAAALRVARTAPIDGSVPGADFGMGPTPVWLITRVVSVLLGIAGAYPALAAVARAGAAGGSPAAHVPAVTGGTLVAQAAVSAAVLGMYLLASGREGTPG